MWATRLSGRRVPGGPGTLGGTFPGGQVIRGRNLQLPLQRVASAAGPSEEVRPSCVNARLERVRLLQWALVDLSVCLFSVEFPLVLIFL